MTDLPTIPPAPLVHPAAVPPPGNRVLDLSPDAAAERIDLLVPYSPGVQWFAVAVPVPELVLDDLGFTPRDVALLAAQEARNTAERVVYDAVLQRRKDSRG